MIQLRTAGISTRAEYPFPEQFTLVTYELTASTVSVPPRRSGPPESPKQVPPDPPPGSPQPAPARVSKSGESLVVRALGRLAEVSSADDPPVRTGA